MVCYSRFLQEILERAGANQTPENKDALERIVRSLLAMQHADCRELLAGIQKFYTEKSREERMEFEKKAVKEMVRFLVTG